MLEWASLVVALVVLALGANMALRPQTYGQGRRRLLVPLGVVRLIGGAVLLLGALLLREAMTLLS